MTNQDSIRDRVLELLRQGLVTHAEAANYLNITRQSARMMCVRANVDAVMARHRYLQRLFHDAVKKGVIPT